MVFMPESAGLFEGRVSQARLKLPTMRQERVWLAVHRFDDSVYDRRINRETFMLQSALRSGATVSKAVALAVDKTKLNAEAQANLRRESFAHASELGWFCPPTQRTTSKPSSVTSSGRAR